MSATGFEEEAKVLLDNLTDPSQAVYLVDMVADEPRILMLEQVVARKQEVWEVLLGVKTTYALVLLEAVADLWGAGSIEADMMLLDSFDWAGKYLASRNTNVRSRLVSCFLKLARQRSGASPIDLARVPDASSEFASAVHDEIMAKHWAEDVHHLPYLADAERLSLLPPMTILARKCRVPQRRHGRIVKVIAIGAAGIGKSTLLNVLCSRNGDGVPEVFRSGIIMGDGMTKDVSEHVVQSPQEEQVQFVFVDSPGAARESETHDDKDVRKAWDIATSYVTESLIRVGKDPVDVVLMCMREPRLHGQDVAFLRQLDDFGVPVILCLLQANSNYPVMEQFSRRLKHWIEGGNDGEIEGCLSSQEQPSLALEPLENIRDVVMVQALASATKDCDTVQAFGMSDLALTIAQRYNEWMDLTTLPLTPEQLAALNNRAQAQIVKSVLLGAACGALPIGFEQWALYSTMSSLITSLLRMYHVRVAGTTMEICKVVIKPMYTAIGIRAGVTFAACAAISSVASLMDLLGPLGIAVSVVPASIANAILVNFVGKLVHDTMQRLRTGGEVGDTSLDMEQLENLMIAAARERRPEFRNVANEARDIIRNRATRQQASSSAP